MEPTVLVVDDEEMTRNLLRLMLGSQGYTIIEAEDGVEALQMIKANPPDVVIMDVMMPNMDGFTACEHLRSQPETANIPIIMLSARTQLEAVRAGLQAGADEYITKPIARRVLLQTIENLLILRRSNKSAI